MLNLRVMPDCKFHARMLLVRASPSKQATKKHLNLISVYDSAAKLPSGVLNGNVNQLGDFDMCLGALSGDGGVQGQYCLAAIEVQKPKNPYLASLHKLVHSHYHFRSRLEDVRDAAKMALWG